MLPAKDVLSLVVQVIEVLIARLAVEIIFSTELQQSTMNILHNDKEINGGIG